MRRFTIILNWIKKTFNVLEKVTYTYLRINAFEGNYTPSLIFVIIQATQITIDSWSWLNLILISLWLTISTNYVPKPYVYAKSNHLENIGNCNRIPFLRSHKKSIFSKVISAMKWIIDTYFYPQEALTEIPKQIFKWTRAQIKAGV